MDSEEKLKIQEESRRAHRKLDATAAICLCIAAVLGISLIFGAIYFIKHVI